MAELTPFPINPPPGITVTDSDRVAEGRWVLPMDKIRIENGRPQMLGGNIRISNTAMSGTPRATHAWRDFSQNQYISCGTYRKLYAFDSSYVPTDITPIADSGTLGNNPFATVSASATVTVTDVAHARGAGDTVIFAGATTFNNVTMNGTYIVQTIVDANSYTVTALTTANATGSGGGAAVTFQYEIGVGTELGAYGQGWGVGPWGLGTWGTARSSSTIFTEPRVWSLDHFGVVLLATYNGGTLWAFDPTQSQPWPRAVGTFAAVAMNAPTDFRAMFITPERFVFGLCDSMVVKVCSQNDPTTWTPATGNTAFQRTLQEGTKLVSGRVLAPYISLVWSDAACYLFQYTGSQFVYNSSLIGKDCGLISPGGAITIGGTAYWWGDDNFWMFNGSVQPMPNAESIRRYVFDAIPAALKFQCTAVYVPKFHQIQFFYPDETGTNPNKYAIFDISSGTWWLGDADFYSSVGVTSGRASGTHFTQGDTSPIFASNDGYLHNHDPVDDDYTDNGAPMEWNLTMAPIAMNEGIRSMQVESVVWDFFGQVGDISATLNGYDRLTDSSPMDTLTQTVPDSDSGRTDYNVGGRYIGMTLSGTGFMRYGKPAALIRATGARQ